jgi:RNA polymerase sigma-70 factor (ECF subfamily)
MLPTRAQASDTSQDIAQAFERLKPKDRDILWMACVECFSHREIAEVLALGVDSIRPALARARARFAEILRRRGLGE